jgi:Brp/Blh family beta-carotene 15,15'-monooxygenase
MRLTRPAQTAIFCAGLLLAVVMNAIIAPGLWAQALILAPAVALLGLPHGALDLPMAQALWPLDGFADRALFFGAYLALAGGVGALWLLAPGVGLAAFLAYSALHFSGDWAADGRWLRVAGGLSAIGAPVLLHTAEAAGIFSALAPTGAAPPIAHAAAVAGLCGGALALLAPLWGAARPRALLEIAAIWIGAALLPPLLYFVAYFCLLHSLRHLVETLNALPDRRRATRNAGGIMALSLLGASLALAALLTGGGLDVETSLMRVVFIGLAALTVPHMLLVERFERRVAEPRPS